MPSTHAPSLARASTSCQQDSTDIDTVRVLEQLRSGNRQGWRCLRNLLTYTDFSHLARRLHLSHQALHELLHQLSRQLGEQHLSLVAGRVRLSDAVHRSLELMLEETPASATQAAPPTTQPIAGAGRSHS